MATGSGRLLNWAPALSDLGSRSGSQHTAEFTATQLPDLAASILTAFGDKYSASILGSTTDRGKAVDEISAELGMPLTTCYRKVQRLQGEGLLFLEKVVVTRAGIRTKKYRASFTTAELRIDSGTVSVKLNLNKDFVKKLRERPEEAQAIREEVPWLLVPASKSKPRARPKG